MPFLTQLEDVVLVDVPDLEILTEGRDLHHAIEMARDAIGITGISMQDHNEPIPKASSFNQIDPQKGTFASDGPGFVTLIDIDFDVYRQKVDNKIVRRNVSLPNWLNREAEKAHINVSGVLQEALKTKLGITR